LNIIFNGLVLIDQKDNEIKSNYYARMKRHNHDFKDGLSHFNELMERHSWVTIRTSSRHSVWKKRSCVFSIRAYNDTYIRISPVVVVVVGYRRRLLLYALNISYNGYI
jgi:hypothetical protein